MTNGLSARPNTSNADHLKRNEGMINVLKELGVNNHQCFDFPDNEMDTTPLLSLITKIEQVITRHQLAIVYAHFSHDFNIDHQITHQAVITAYRPIWGSSVIKTFSSEVLSSTEWQSSSEPDFNAHFLIVAAWLL